MTSYTTSATWPPSSPRRELWRLVRDAGKTGLTAKQAAQLLPHRSGNSVQVTIDQLKKHGFLCKYPNAHIGYAGGTAYYFDALTCRVPVGEVTDVEGGLALEQAEQAACDADPDSTAALVADAPAKAVVRLAVRSVFEFLDPVELPPRRNVLANGATL